MNLDLAWQLLKQTFSLNKVRRTFLNKEEFVSSFQLHNFTILQKIHQGNINAQLLNGFFYFFISHHRLLPILDSTNIKRMDFPYKRT